mgnify:CR=1 FL=1
MRGGEFLELVAYRAGPMAVFAFPKDERFLVVNPPLQLHELPGEAGKRYLTFH